MLDKWIFLHFCIWCFFDEYFSSDFSSDNSLAKSTAKNKIPPNCVAGNDAGQTIPIFIKVPSNYTF